MLYTNSSFFDSRACEKGNVGIVNLLLEKGASGQCNPFTGISPLYAACVHENVDVVKPLLVKFPGLVKQGTKVEKNNPLHIVSGNGNVHIIKLMLQTDDGLVAFSPIMDLIDTWNLIRIC